ncbi:hypothetical protein [Megalodesulfovibrio gigas]|uniref:Uncharacterized protein n=1 Tax=Megalodesulfovibrio gigas (strain ATCC 19364 / DSM 1382 / NCIMB 9332 / VKM B-1759) TaxID=1121448 RepID=T2G908_MEGG1|nr:hypothetical protein [Megalodesulfovibrio gigas]AGW12596.1 hypothetical protein DGI_0692 [Megalodesulfovibrio gigas DSM 1382 = ATCC 19364]
MQDELGFYYYPNPSQHDTRCYVRKNQQGNIEFRLWNRQEPRLWEQHGWLSLEIIRQAAGRYSDRQPDKNPMLLYDEAVARMLLAEAK